MEKRLKTHPSQWSVLLDFEVANPQILTKKFDGVGGRKKFNQLWQEIAETLNSMGYLKKTVDKWQKAVADWKSKVKAKASDLNKSLTQTGGGGQLLELNDNERRLIAILGTSFITGIKTNKELGLSQCQREVAPQLKFALPNKTNTLSVSPPPLLHSITGMEIDSMPVILVQTEEPYNDESEAAATPSSSLSKPNSPLLKKSVEKESKTKSTPKKRMWEGTTPQKTQPSNLEKMHEDTLDVLKQINKNIERMADSQEKMAQAIEKLIADK